MNKKSLYKALAVAAFPVFGIGLTSCNDFLEIIPMNDVVLENYWTERKDVISVLYGCYESLESKDNVTRMGLWGEVRSDNMKMGTNTPYEVEQIIKENMLPTNSYCRWTSFYETINRCNILCHYAPKVHEIDPNYTETEMDQNIAEAVTIRSLCYFYLMRTFRDVPYTKEASIDDTQDYRLPATPFDELLDILIADLEDLVVEGHEKAAKRYVSEFTGMNLNRNSYENTSRVTRYTVYALLADLYLWKGDWDNCIKYCDKVIKHKQDLYNERLQMLGTVRDIQLFGDWPLLMERPVGATNSGSAYGEIFGNGNSFESIFELYFARDKGAENVFPNDFYYKLDQYRIANLSVPTEFYGELPATEAEGGLFKKTDCRVYSSISPVSTSSHAIMKYSYQSVSMDTRTPITATTLKFSGSKRSTNYANWIIYRLTDIMLMKAEALVEKGSDADLAEAFRLVNAVYCRANNIFTETGTGSLNKAKYGSQEEMRNLVLDERHRELLFEGKRWYDLVRMACRQGNTKKLAEIVVKKQTVDQNSIKIRLADPNILYFPYAKDELKVNPNLHQNSAYSNGVEDDLSKN